MSLQRIEIAIVAKQRDRVDDTVDANNHVDTLAHGNALCAERRALEGFERVKPLGSRSVRPDTAGAETIRAMRSLPAFSRDMAALPIVTPLFIPS